MTGPELFALARGRKCEGPHRCFWCGAACDGSLPCRAGETFHDWSLVACPRSPYVCVGCDLATDAKTEMKGREKPQKPWNYSWLLTASEARPLTKADLGALRAACLSPPPAPWALALADSGQKHVLYRTPVNGAGSLYSVQLETLRVVYDPGDLAARLALCGKVAAAIGKPVLSGPLDLSCAMRYAEHHGTDALGDVDDWNAVWNSPVSRLAAFLSPSKEDALREYPKRDDVGDAAARRGRVPAAAGRAGRRAGERGLFA